MKPLPFGFAPPLFKDLMSVKSSLAFLSGRWRAAPHSQPPEMPPLRFYLFLCTLTPSTVTFLRNAATHPPPPSSERSCFLSALSFPPPPVVYMIHRHTHLRPTLKTVVTSGANLWLLHCHIKNENQCVWLRELAALLNSEMTLVSGLHWVLHLIASSLREMWRHLSLFPSWPRRVNINWRDRVAPEPGSLQFQHEFFPSGSPDWTRLSWCLSQFQTGWPLKLFSRGVKG